MNKKKNITITVIIVAVIAILGVWFYNSPEVKLYRKNQAYLAQRQQDLKSKNQAMYESLQKSIKEGEEAVKKEPNKFDPWFELAANYQNFGDLAKAEEAYKKALAINKLSDYAWSNLGALYMRQERYDMAKEAYLKWLEILPDDENAYIAVAQLYATGKVSGGADAARAILQEGIRRTNSALLKQVLEKLNKEGKI